MVATQAWLMCGQPRVLADTKNFITLSFVSADDLSQIQEPGGISNLAYSCEPFGKSRNLSEWDRLQLDHIAEGLQVLVITFVEKMKGAAE